MPDLFAQRQSTPAGAALRSVLIVAAAVLLAGLLTYCSYGMLWPTTYTHTTASQGFPVIMRARNGPSAAMVNTILQNEGGLPKRLMSLTSYRLPDGTQTIGSLDRIAGHPLEVFPVDEIEILQTIVKGGDILALARRGELAFTVDMQFRIEYADGDTGVLRWSAWGYGFALGPFVGSRDGPAGDLYVIEASWNR